MAVALILLLVAVASVLFHLWSPWWWTPIASNWSYIDHTITMTFWITGAVFFAVVAFMAYCIFRFHHKEGRQAAYEPENKKLEWWLTIGTAIGVGAMLAPAAVIAAELDATLVNMRFVKPLDEAMILELAKTHEAFVTLEDNAVAGGAGSGVAECLAAHGVTLPILHLGLPDVYLEHGSREEVLTMAGLDLPGIRHAIRARFPQLVAAAATA